MTNSSAVLCKREECAEHITTRIMMIRSGRVFSTNSHHIFISSLVGATTIDQLYYHHFSPVVGTHSSYQMKEKIVKHSRKALLFSVSVLNIQNAFTRGCSKVVDNIFDQTHLFAKNFFRKRTRFGRTCLKFLKRGTFL